MNYFSILLFFAYTYCLGFTATSFVKNSENFLERNLMRIGFGLSLLPFLALVLNLFRIPADWRILLALSLAYPVIYIVRNYSRFDYSNLKIRLTKTNLVIITVLIIFVLNFYIHLTGSFNYPYLEDEDPWSHAHGVKFVSLEKNVFNENAKNVRYINPYPPTYDLLLGILHQTNDSVYWTLKFFNALIVSLSVVFFFFFVKQLTGSLGKSLFAAFVLFSIPSFLSHFIWAISLSVPLYFVILYCCEMINQDKKWWIISGLVMATALTSSPTHSTYFGFVFGIYLIFKIIIERKILFNHILAGIFGLSLSAFSWWIPMLVKNGLEGTLKGVGMRPSLGVTDALAGSGDRIYIFKDFVFARKENMINNPIGIGIILCLLLLIFLAYIYFSQIKIFGKLKSTSRIKYYSGKALIFLSVFLLVIGIISFYGTNEYDPRNIEHSNSLKTKVNTSLYFIFSSLIILLLLVCYNSKEIENDNRWMAIGIAWLIFAIYSVNGAVYAYKISPFRAWMILAFVVSILAGSAADFIIRLAGKIPIKILIIGLLVTGVYYTSTQQKISVNTSVWPPGAFWTSSQEIEAYLWLYQNLPKNTPVYTFGAHDQVIAMDMYSCRWCQDVRDYDKNGFKETIDQNLDWLRTRHYKYILVDGRAALKFGINETNEKIQEMINSGQFKPVFQNQGAIIFSI